VFLIAVILNDHEIVNITVLPFIENVLAIFLVVFMTFGIDLAIFNRLRRKTQTRGHYFETRLAEFVEVADSPKEVLSCDTRHTATGITNRSVRQ